MGGEPIEIFKFRSMVVHREHGKSVTQAAPNDKRVTAIGRFLRHTSMDELPQLFNVLKGEMSLVGPRPHALEHTDLYKSRIPRYMLRHKVKPGITGWAQVNGFRGQTDTPEKMALRIEHDLWYIQNWSLWLDVKILLMTPFMMMHRNAY
jgi:lipopolysaccharide/colanic/teichoic acid biosynthesis glycosyltransferase